MDSITELIQEICINNFNIGSSLWVDVTNINNPHSFYVRPTSYRKYMSVIAARSCKATETDLHLQNIIYKSKILQFYCRGKVLQIKNNDNDVTCDIFAIDFGCFDQSILLKRIYKSKYKFNIPPLALHCQLADCKPKGDCWTNKETDAMKFFIGEERAKLIVRGQSQDKLIVELINTCPDDIATILALTGYTTLGYSNNMISQIPQIDQESQYYSFKKFKPGDTLCVRIQSGSVLNEFYVAQIEDYKKYVLKRGSLMSGLKDKFSIRSEDLKEKLPICVFVPQLCRYERGVIRTIKVSEEKVMVQLVDWGSIIEANVSQIKAMSKIHFVDPPIAIYCSVEQCQIYDNLLQRFLYPGYEFLITVKETGNELSTPHIVNISPVNKMKR